MCQFARAAAPQSTVSSFPFNEPICTLKCTETSVIICCATSKRVREYIGQFSLLSDDDPLSSLLLPLLSSLSLSLLSSVSVTPTCIFVSFFPFDSSFLSTFFEPFLPASTSWLNWHVFPFLQVPVFAKNLQIGFVSVFFAPFSSRPASVGSSFFAAFSFSFFAFFSEFLISYSTGRAYLHCVS